MLKKIGVIGSGFSGLSAATELASLGYEVHLFEKNSSPGGRARSFESKGFRFDMGPSWYWMPDVFEKYFSHYGVNIQDYFSLLLLDPGFKVIYGAKDELDIPADFDQLLEMFESIETGSAKKLKKFMNDAKYKYNVGINKLVHKPGLSIFEFFDLDLIKGLFKLDVFKSFEKYINGIFHDERLRMLLKFPVLFLGAKPEDTPALYSLMNYAGLKLGTWYPIGGMSELVRAMVSLAKSKGVNIHFNEAVEEIHASGSMVNKISTTKMDYELDGVIASGDYHHIESKLIKPQFRNYDESYWSKKTFAPSSLIFYLGLDKKLARLEHHNLFFDTQFSVHAKAIYDDPSWPEKPLFYLCCPSKTDANVAPEGCENLFILIPLATGLEDNEDFREEQFNKVMQRLEKYTAFNIREHIICKRSYCVNDFKKDYNAYGGNAYGLANTLLQTANLKPSLRNKKLKNLFYAGQLTVPGPGVPPSLISGKLAARQLNKILNLKS